MRFLSTCAHGAVDYLTGALPIISPWLFSLVVLNLVTQTVPERDARRQASGTPA